VQWLVELGREATGRCCGGRGQENSCLVIVFGDWFGEGMRVWTVHWRERFEWRLQEDITVVVLLISSLLLACRK
jgi:hypothetical protein